MPSLTCVSDHCGRVAEDAGAELAERERDVRHDAGRRSTKYVNVQKKDE